MLIDVLRGRPAGDRLRELRSTAEPPFVCAINIEEVWRGARPSEEPRMPGLQVEHWPTG